MAVRVENAISIIEAVPKGNDDPPAQWSDQSIEPRNSKWHVFRNIMQYDHIMIRAAFPRV